jgi:hypothetical protein
MCASNDGIWNLNCVLEGNEEELRDQEKHRERRGTCRFCGLFWNNYLN